MGEHDDKTEAYRERIWQELRKVARPDSRFHWDFSSFITDFEGSDVCAERLFDLVAQFAGDGRRIFVTPDNCLEDFRARLIMESRPFVMTTYGIVRGFYELDPAKVPPGAARHAATLDGFDRYATPVTLRELQAGDPFGLLVTGGSAVSRNGVRFGKGHGYFDFEYAVLSELGLVDNATTIADVVHDCQYVDDHLDAEAHDVPVDWIVTPSSVRAVDGPPRTPGHVFWELVPGTEFEHLHVTAELRDITKPTPHA